MSESSTSDTAKDVLVNSRLLGHTRHPTITDIPLGSWTVTLMLDLMELMGQKQDPTAADVSLSVGLGASLLASAGGLADLSQTYSERDRRLGATHGILHGLTMVLYGGSLAARRYKQSNVGRMLAFAGYGTLLAAAYLGGALAEKRHPSLTPR